MKYNLKKIFSAFLPLFVLIACKNSSNEIKPLTFQENTDLEISVDQFSTNIFLLSQLLTTGEGSEFLIHINTFASNPNYIFFDNLQNPEKSFRLDLPQDGPEGVGRMTDLHVASMDSIFVFDRYAYRMSLIDTSGKIKRAYRLKISEGTKPDEDSAIPRISSKSLAFTRGRTIYIPAIPDTDPYQLGYKNENLLIALDLENGQFEYMLGFPSKYKNGGDWGGPDHFLPSIAATEEPSKVLISYPVDDSLYVFDLSEKELKPAFFLKSQLLSDRYSSNQIDRNNHEQVLKHQLGTDYFFSLIYDSFRKKYYRFASQRYSEEDIDKMIKREKGGANKQSVIEFDAELNFIQEYSLPKGRTPYTFYPRESGCYFSLLNTNDENKIILNKAIFD